MLYFVLKFVHVIGAAVLLGTGAGIAFFMLLAHRDGRPQVVAGVARIVVIADFLFTATLSRRSRSRASGSPSMSDIH